MATVAGKIRRLPPQPYPTVIKGTLVFASYPNGIVVKKWPDKRPGKLHAVTQQQKRTWDLVQEMIKFIDAGEYAQALALSENTRFYRRDILVMSAYGHYVSFPDPGYPPQPPPAVMDHSPAPRIPFPGPSALSPSGGWGPYPSGALSDVKTQLHNQKTKADLIAGDTVITAIADIGKVGINAYVTGPNILMGTIVLAYAGPDSVSLSHAPTADATQETLTFTTLRSKGKAAKTKGNTAQRDAGDPQGCNVITHMTATNDGAVGKLVIVTYAPAAPTLMLFCCSPLQVKVIERRGLATIPGKGPWWFPCHPQWFIPTSSDGTTHEWDLPADLLQCDNCFYTFAELAEPGALRWGSQYYPCPAPGPIGSGGYLYGEADANLNVAPELWMASASVATVSGTLIIEGDYFLAAGAGFLEGGGEFIFNGAPGATAVAVLVDGEGDVLATGTPGTCDAFGEGV